MDHNFPDPPASGAPMEVEIVDKAGGVIGSSGEGDEFADFEESGKALDTVDEEDQDSDVGRRYSPRGQSPGVPEFGQQDDDSDMERYSRKGEAAEEIKEEVSEEVVEDLPDETESDYKVTEIQIQDDSRMRLSMGEQEIAFPEEGKEKEQEIEEKTQEKQPKPEEKKENVNTKDSKKSTKEPDTMVNYASVKATVKRREQRSPGTPDSVNHAVNEIEKNISKIPPRYSPNSSAEGRRPGPKRNVIVRPVSAARSKPDPKPAKKKTRPMTAQERKNQRDKAENVRHLAKTQRLNKDLRGVLSAEKVKGQKYKDILTHAENQLGGRAQVKKRELDKQAAAEKQWKLELTEEAKARRKELLKPKKSASSTGIIKHKGIFTQDLSKLTNAKDYQDIADKERQRKNTAVAVKAIKAVGSVEDVLKATRRNKSSLSPIQRVLQGIDRKEQGGTGLRLPAKRELKPIQAPPKYQKPKFVIEAEKKKKREMEQMQKLAKQRLLELKRAVRGDEGDLVAELERVTRANKRKEKLDALPDEAGLYDQQAMLEQMLALRKKLELLKRNDRKMDRQLQRTAQEQEAKTRELQILALQKPVVDLGNMRFERLPLIRPIDPEKRSIVELECSPLKQGGGNFESQEVTPLERLAYYLEERNLTPMQAYALLDSNGDGVLTLNEILEGVGSQLGVAMSRKDLVAMTAQMDVDGDGVLTRREFISALEDPLRAEGGQIVRQRVKNVDVSRELEVQEMLLDMKAKMKLMRERLPKLKRENCFHDPEVKKIAGKVVTLETDITKQKQRYAREKASLLAKLEAGSQRPELEQKLHDLRAFAEQERAEWKEKVDRLQAKHEELRTENAQQMQVNLLLKEQKSSLKDQQAHLAIRLRMTKDLNRHFAREVKGFVQRSELDFHQLYDIQNKQIIQVDYDKEEAYRRKAGEFLGEAFSTQRAMARNTLLGLRAKAAVHALKEHHHEKWEMKRNVAQRLFRAMSFLAMKGVQLKQSIDSKKRAKEREERRKQLDELKASPEYRAATKVQALWRRYKQLALVSTKKAKDFVVKELGVRCSQCPRKMAEIECFDCETPFCLTCYDATHRSGQRRQHNTKAIIVRRGKKIEDDVAKEAPSLFPLRLRDYSDEEFLQEFWAILGKLGLDMMYIIISTIPEEQRVAEGRAEVITTAQLHTAFSKTVHQLKDQEILRFNKLIYKQCSWHPQNPSEWKYYIDCEKLFALKP